jgi:hypothetical protein
MELQGIELNTRIDQRKHFTESLGIQGEEES